MSFSLKSLYLLCRHGEWVVKTYSRCASWKLVAATAPPDDVLSIIDWITLIFWSGSFWTASWDRSKCAIRTPACTVPLDIQDTRHVPVLLHWILSWRGAGYGHKDMVDTAIMTAAHPALLLVRPGKFSESSCCMPFQENSVQLSQDMVHHRFDSDWACCACLCLCCPICFVWCRALNWITLYNLTCSTLAGRSGSHHCHLMAWLP